MAFKNNLLETTNRQSDIAMLHPAMRENVVELMKVLDKYRRLDQTIPVFRVFETYRSPARQRQMLFAKRSKAGAWESAHQWGFAADIVPYGGSGFTWDATPRDWLYLKTAAREVGLDVPITWDKAHVQHPVWTSLLTAQRSGSSASR